MDIQEIWNLNVMNLWLFWKLYYPKLVSVPFVVKIGVKATGNNKDSWILPTMESPLPCDTKKL